MKRYRLTIYRAGVAPIAIPAIARSSADALLAMLEQLGDLAGVRVTVRPA